MTSRGGNSGLFTRRAFLIGGGALAVVWGVREYRLTPPDHDGTKLSASEAHERAVAGALLLIDIRTPREWQATGIGEGALNRVKSPRWVLLGKAKNQVDDHLADAWATDVLSLVARVPLLSDEHPMPLHDRIWREERDDFLEALATEDLALDRESTPSVVAE